ncbi:type II toxin-antitoxin system prevent-host-death family antitoxin [Streptomyces sp. NBC_00207]|uniref:type II toxin-antitoxin system prevent-host-death family antitoxin n=1 Tax=unclassified Streptomyces TaxID=2593676 RepID=UPI0028881830|nr:type II toxin-antitoxin system prevent-host-death family antitoxin [Streptomyces sp. DSM 41633]
MEATTITADELRKGWADVLAATYRAGRHHQVTRHGKAAVSVIPPEWYAQAAGADGPAVREETATEGLRSLADLLEDVRIAGTHVAITRRGTRVAVLVPHAWAAERYGSPA